MLKNDEIKYIEDKIKKILSSVSNEYYQLTMSELHSSEDDASWREDWLINSLVDLYYYISTYLEAREMPLLLQSFQDKFKEQITKKLNLLDSELTHPEGDFELKIIIAYKRFLSSFKPFDYSELQEEEFSKLIKILRNTGFIIRNSKAIITGETDIYNQVRWILSLYFPSCRAKGKAGFIKQFKSYNPDILIPELKTAIEYKYLRDKSKNIDEFIDQIIIDSVGYTGDYNYDNFVAVFYISDAGIATPESIELAWKAKKIPNNWTLIITGEHISPGLIK